MARWGKCDFAQLQGLEARLTQLEQAELDRFFRAAAQDLAVRLLAKAVKRTPVGAPPRLEGPKAGEIRSEYWAGYQGGALRQGWTVLPIEKKGGAYQITVTNNLLYASYVEYGHRQTPGRYVPALGKRLKAAWVPGRYMMTISAQELERLAPALLEKRLHQFLRGCFDAG